jgi:nucleoid DNA-binding protein
MHINQTTLAEHVAARSGVPIKQVSAVLRATFDVIALAVVRGDEVRVTNFGTFIRREAAAVLRRNPQTDERVMVPAHGEPKLSWSETVREAVRTGEAPDTFRKLGKGKTERHR